EKKLATKRHKFCAFLWLKILSAEPPGVVDLGVAAVQIHFPGFLVAAAFRESRAATDEPSARECHRSEVSSIAQLPKTNGENRSVRKCFNRDTRTGQLFRGPRFHTPNDGLTVRIELRLPVSTQKLKQKLSMISAQNKSSEPSRQRQGFRL